MPAQKVTQLSRVWGLNQQAHSVTCIVDKASTSNESVAVNILEGHAESGAPAFCMAGMQSNLYLQLHL